MTAVRNRITQDKVSWGTRRGTCKGGGASSKAKGRAAVQAVRDLLTKTFGWEPDDTLVKATSQVGEDLHLSPRARRDFPFGVEVKCVEGLNIFKALEQAQHQAPDRAPIVFFKRAHTPMFVALKAEDFLRLMARGQNDEPSVG